MASRKESASLKVIAKKKEKTNKKLTWTDQDTDVLLEVISDPLYRGSDYTVGWATMLKRLSLKKSSNIKIFEEIQECRHIGFDLYPSFHSAPQHRNTRLVTRVKYLDKLFVKIRLRFYTKTIYLSEG